ncbi:hypothetical protein [Aeromonas veronii]|uniref:ApeA N-terminal domain 1-containing protein n=1 Tax=Aeromonas veronii TaxID=654 RepID=UPI000206A9A2|nr:hypothetical protein [Aeromonas veronii]AEB50488.1 hypothetical protein B565_2453 [Aeromonas veronii B565]MBS4690969.1 hypothetical protein [Aeromonas veronii bv. veronii]
MTKNAFDFSKEYEWTGEFYFKNFSHRFFGKVTYSSEKGLHLHYTAPSTEDEIEKTRTGKVLYAALDNGRLCTLFGDFNFGYAGLRCSDINTHYGVFSVAFCIFGGHLSEDAKFDEVCFEFDNTQEFFFPAGYVDHIKFNKEALYKVVVPDGVISVENAAKFKYLPNDLRGALFCENEQALNDLQAAWDKIREEYKNVLLTFKTELSYYFRLKKNNNVPIKELLREVFRVSDLLSLFFDRPVYAKEIKFIERANPNDVKTLPVLASMAINKSTLKLAQSKVHHLHLPLTTRTVDLEKALMKWYQIDDSHSSIVSIIQHETGYRTEHETNSELVLFATQLESINISLSGKSIEKYTKPINKYGSDLLIDRLRNALQVQKHDCYGKKLADLRNEIAHVGRPKTLLKAIGHYQRMVISRCLKLIIQSYLLSMLGIEDVHIKEYQKHNLPTNEG